MRSWFQNELSGHDPDILLRKDVGSFSLFEQEMIRQMIAAHAHLPGDNERHLFSLLSFETWHQVFLLTLELDVCSSGRPQPSHLPNERMFTNRPVFHQYMQR